MTRMTGTTYQCNQCEREEREPSQVLSWLTVRLLRDEIAPMRGLAHRTCGPLWRRDFCSRGCLAGWAMTETAANQDSVESTGTKDDETNKRCSGCKWWTDVKGPYSDGMWGKCDLSGMVGEKPKHEYKTFRFIAGGCSSGIEGDCYLHTHGNFGCKNWSERHTMQQ